MRVSSTAPGRRRRTWLGPVGLIIAAVIVLVAVGGAWLLRQPPRDRHDGTHAWMSGASGDGVADGSFASWRGRPVTIAGTWNDSEDGQTEEWTLQSGAEYGAWQGDLDVAIGAIYEDQGETWAAAASGAYDDRWRTALEALAAARQGHRGVLYIRFAHEFNGEWEPWKVTGDEASDFVTAWRRFRVLQQQILPQSRLVFCPSAGSSASLDLDWRTAFPGTSQVDVVGVDFYNQYPFATDQAQFDADLGARDDHGAPRGLEAYRRFAESEHLSLAIPEWSSNADMGDGAPFVTAFHSWLTQHGGSGPGEVLYEIEFNVGDFGDGQFQFYPSTNQAAAAAAYRELW